MRDSEIYWKRAAHFRELAVGLDLKTAAAIILLAEDYEGLAREMESASKRPLSTDDPLPT